MMARRVNNSKRQSGMAAVEFALCAVFVFFPLFFGIVEMGRLLFYWNAAVEATRVGARTAVVCDKDSPAIFTKMKTMLPILNSDQDISVTYPAANCTADCQLTVSVKPDVITVTSFTQFVPFASIKLPSMSTTLTTESLQSSFDGRSNPMCN